MRIQRLQRWLAVALLIALATRSAGLTPVSVDAPSTLPPECANALEEISAAQLPPLEQLREVMYAKGRPVILRNAQAAMGWNATSISWAQYAAVAPATLEPVWIHNGTETVFVRYTVDSSIPQDLPFWEPLDARHELWPRFGLISMPKDDFFGKLAASEAGEPLESRIYFQTASPFFLREYERSVRPRDHLDFGSPTYGLWISSADVRTHSHWDRNFNFFAQLRGSKRFTLVSPVEHGNLAPYPCVHGMYSQLQLNFEAVNRTRFPAFANVKECFRVDVHAGDILVIPPYWVHHIRALSSSVSLSIHSYPPPLKREIDAVQAAYEMPLPIDVDWPRDKQKLAAVEFLRATARADSELFAWLDQSRYVPLFGLEPQPDARLCFETPVSARQRSLMRRHVASAANEAMTHFAVLAPPQRRIYMASFVEEVLWNVLGVRDLLPTLRHCLVASDSSE